MKKPEIANITIVQTKSDIPALEEIFSGIKSDTTPTSESINIVTTTTAKKN